PVTVLVDNTPPAAAMGAVAANVRGVVALTSSASDTGSGVASVGYELSPAGAGSWSTVAASWNTTTLTDGVYDVRAVVVDRAGNRTDSTPVTTRVDNTPPTATMNDPADSNGNLYGTVALTSTTADSGSGLAQTWYELSPAGADAWTHVAASLDTTTVPDGLYDIRAAAVDNAGNGFYS